jgi:peptidoglycan/LPS O-acetylase OafA/YrhL
LRRAPGGGSMNKTFSIYLDAVRFLAAMGVFASHLFMPRWTFGAFPDGAASIVLRSGVDLVMVFFVLSGFVIAYTVHAKDRNWQNYAFNRATRIYSVAIPAIIFTYLLDSTGVALNPADYNGWWYADHSLLNLLVRGLTFSNEFWQWEFRVGTNGPYWSLGYEIWYYVLFGVLAFSRGWVRFASFAMIALLVGPGVWLLAPVWAMGALLYWGYSHGRLTPRASVGSFVSGAVMAIMPIVLYGALRVTDGNNIVNAAGDTILSTVGLFGSAGRAAPFLWFWVVGALVSMHFIGVLFILQNVKARLPAAVASSVRWLAGGSYSIYLIHYPVLQAIDALLIGETSNPLRVLVLAVATLAFCFLFAAIFERRLSAFRGAVRALANRDGSRKRYAHAGSAGPVRPDRPI